MNDKRYFKITNSTENHNGFQYVNGLNILQEPFQEEGSCVKGGLYFSNAKHILKFLAYGIYLREITLPDMDSDFKMVKDPSFWGDKWRANKIILGKRYNLSDVSTFEYLISLGADFDPRNAEMLWASRNGYLEIAKFFISKNTNFEFWYNCAAAEALNNNHTDIVRFLIKRGVTLNISCDKIILRASTIGHLETVKFLVEMNANSTTIKQAMQCASKNSHREIIAYLQGKITP